MEYLHSIMFKLIEIIKNIISDIFDIFNFDIFNFDIFNIGKILLLLFIIYIILINLYKLFMSFKRVSYDKVLFKIYKILKKKNFISKNLINDILEKRKKSNVTKVNFKEDIDIKLFKLIKKQIQIKYNLNNISSTDIIYYLYALIKKINN
jgi:hypothetical protein